MFQPKGLTQGGIYLERNHRWPNIFGHVMAIHMNEHELSPGDFILFTHLTDLSIMIEGDPPDEVEFVLIHVNSVLANFGKDLVTLKKLESV